MLESLEEAPTDREDVAALKETIEQLQDEVIKWQTIADAAAIRVSKINQVNVKLFDLLKEARVALTQYADKKNWSRVHYDSQVARCWKGDGSGYDLARKALNLPE